MKLGVNIDHIATLRQARLEAIPDPVVAAREAIAGGADGIVCHLREDRRHIQDKDVFALRKRFDLTCNLWVDVRFVDYDAGRNHKVFSQFDDSFQIVQTRDGGLGNDYGCFSAADRGNHRTAGAGRAVKDHNRTVWGFIFLGRIFSYQRDHFSGIFFAGFQGCMAHLSVTRG